MGGRAGGGAGMGKGSRGGGGMSARAQQLANQYLGDVKSPALRKELAEGLEAFEKEFGIPAGVHVLVNDLGERTYGAAVGSGRIRISSRYKTGEHDISHAKHTMIHELTHVLDKSDSAWGKNTEFTKDSWGRYKKTLKSENKGYAKKLTAAYKTFKLNYGSPATKQIGSYALKNKHEFFAESLAHYMTGTKNQYTTFAYNLAKSMK